MHSGGYAATDVGRKRNHNEDAHRVDDDLGLYVVADGMGGHAAGEVASARCVERVHARLSGDRNVLSAFAEAPDDPARQAAVLALVELAFQDASEDIYRLSQSEAGGGRSMGTTCVMLLRAGRKAVVGHVGDSRAYLLRNGQAHQLTEDHTLVNAQLKRGLISAEEAAEAENRNVVTRSVGYQEAVQVDTLITDVLPGDRFLLCSDGLSNYVQHEEWAKFLGAGEAAALPDKLVKLANHRGGRDNITAVVVEVAGQAAGPRKAEVESRLEVLRGSALFRHLSYKELIQVLSFVQTREVEAAEVLVGPGEVSEALYIVLRGEVVSAGPGGEARLGAGAHFGELALLHNAPSPAGVRAASPATLLVIDRGRFYALLRQDAQLAVKLLWAFLQVLAGHLRPDRPEAAGPAAGPYGAV